MTTVDRLFEEASKLTHEERAELVDRLSILDDDSIWASPEIRDAWMAEIDRRTAAIEAGTEEFVPWEQVRERMYERLRALRG